MWILPAPRHSGGYLLDDAYSEVLAEVLEIISKAHGVLMGLDDTKNRLAKSISKVIVHFPRSVLIEYFRSDLKREKTANVMSKVVDVLQRLDQETGLPRTVFSLISESCKCMRDVRRKILEKDHVLWEKGCATHCIHNLSSEFASLDYFIFVIKDSLYVAKKEKNTGMVRKLLDHLSKEKLGKTLSIQLFPPTRWKTCHITVLRLRESLTDLTLMSYDLLNECEQRGIDATYVLPSKWE